MVILRRIVDQILYKTAYIGRFFLLALMITIIVDVIGRRFFKMSSVSLQELEWHFHGALFLLCLGFTYMKDAHVRVDLFRDWFSSKVNRWIEVIGCSLFLLPYCAVVIYFGIDFTIQAYTAGEMSATAEGLPYRWVIKSLLPIGFFLLGLSGIAVLLNPDKDSHD